MTAEFSPCGRYRYSLTRQIGLFGKLPAIAFVMLNPSTADAVRDDPTIRRCKNFAERFSGRQLIVVNLFAFRSKNPSDLIEADDPVGPQNDVYLRGIAGAEIPIVCAWGASAPELVTERVPAFLRIIEAAGALHRLHHLGLTKDGSPRHPLYVRAQQPLTRWEINP